MKKLSMLIALILCAALMMPALADVNAAPGNPETVPEGLEIDWDARYTYAELEAQMKAISETYPGITEMYEIGHTWCERSLWCVEITNEAIAKEDKTGIAVFGNIHGGERESGSAAMYFMWWLAVNSDTEYVQNILDNYVVYVIPVINPDGYEQSFIINTRQNLRPRDLNGDGTAFSDPYTDIDGDGYISYLFKGSSTDDMSGPLTCGESFMGRESADWDKNGVLADDPRNSGIDMNRIFDYHGIIRATEPEVQAVQSFLVKTDINALVTLHTGIQCVLYPWCYRAYDAEIDSEDIPFMRQTAAAMAAAAQNITGRGFYSMSSYEDYPTSGELIDYAYGELNIHAYTIEVYRPGKSATGDVADCCWENTLPDPTLAFYTRAEVEAMGLDLSRFDMGDAEGIWFYTASTDQMTDKAPEDQKTMVMGARDAILVMIESEPFGNGKYVPAYLR